MRIALLCSLCLVTTAAPAVAIDWPVADTPMLELSNETTTVRFPAPVWIERARREEMVTEPVNVRARWRVFAGGFDLIAEQLDASIDAGADWDLGPLSYVNDVFFDDCDFMHQKWADLDPGENSPIMYMSYALCGYDFGNASGGMFIGVSMVAGEDQYFDLWYLVPLRPFDINDEGAWPMSAADLEATTRALAAAITVTPR